jgi:hypothetical protein
MLSPSRTGTPRSCTCSVWIIEKLTYKVAGLDDKLTSVFEARVVNEILA